MLTIEEGGRHSSFFTGYRPSFRFNGQYNDVVVNLINKTQVTGGDTVEAHLTFIAPEFQRNRLFVGLQFDLTEGPRAVCRGTITKVLEESMLTGPPTPPAR